MESTGTLKILVESLRESKRGVRLNLTLSGNSIANPDDLTTGIGSMRTNLATISEPERDRRPRSFHRQNRDS